MTLATTTSRASYSGDGGTQAFAFPYRFLLNSDLVVILRDAAGLATLQVLGTHYSVTGAGLGAGGTVTFFVAPSNTTNVQIYRDPPVTQTASYSDNDPFPANAHEGALDKGIMVAQRTRDMTIRSLHLPDGDPIINMTLATAEVRANKLLGWDANGNPVSFSFQIAPVQVTTGVLAVSQISQRLVAIGQWDTINDSMIGGPSNTVVKIWTSGGSTTVNGPLLTSIFATLGYNTTQQAAFIAAAAVLPY